MNLVTVCGHNTTMLYHMLKHYYLHMDEIFVVLYAHHKKDPIIEEALNILDNFNLKPYKIVYDEPFNWEKVTEYYNEVKLLKPNDWWIVADDDELQLYSKPIETIVQECEEFGYEFVTGGFVDRIGDNGDFPKITKESNLWEEMPEAGFFRYPLSKACPNKVTMMKGSVKVCSGQHYVEFPDGTTSWGSEHPKRYPIEKNFTQVHHFKWDYSVLERLKEVSKTKANVSFAQEYKLMLDEIIKSDYKIDLTKEEFMFQRLGNGHYHQLHTWNDLRKKNSNNLTKHYIYIYSYNKKRVINMAKTATDEHIVMLEERKVKALEKIANVLDALTLWFEDIDKTEWSERTQWYLAEMHNKYLKEDK